MIVPLVPLMLLAALQVATRPTPVTPPASVPPPAAARVERADGCDDKPVLMVVSGPTHDRARMLAYARAIFATGLYERLGGYYLNGPVPLATFEGPAPAGYTNLIVRFPCLANARAFWFSRDYQERIRPLRLNPSAGDYIVTVYPEAAVRADMAGAVGDNGYRRQFSADGIELVSPQVTNTRDR